MAKQFNEIVEEVELPKSYGLTNLLGLLKEIFGLPRTTEVLINARGGKLTVSYKRFALPDEPERPLKTDLKSLSPYNVLRGNPIRDLTHSDRAPLALAQALDAVGRDGFWPIAFVAGQETALFGWCRDTGPLECDEASESFLGFPLFRDEALEPHILLLAASYHRGGALVDTARCYKLSMPWDPTKSSVE